ncbi:MAG: menaquinone biosynthesis decarboxylase, partial [Planctomycetes bacterium]|nr:menaquinone biosynthesis decarboxylase [Planctomycetota bacterium]
CMAPGVRQFDTLNHAAPYDGYGSKIGLDATAKLPGEGVVRPWPDPIRMSPEVVERVAARWASYGLSAPGGRSP